MRLRVLSIAVLALGTATNNDTRVQTNKTEGTVVETHGQPKSGTTWLEVITVAIITAGGGKANKKTRSANFANETLVSNEKHRLPGAMSKAKAVHVAIERSFDAFLKRCVDDGITIGSEACVPPAFLGPLPDNARYVLILRDPRAVVVSWAHYNERVNLTSQGKASEDYIIETVPKCAALVSLRYYWHDELVRRTHPSLILFYEDLAANPVDEYYRLASFLGVSLEPDVMLGVIHRTSAASMKKDEQHHRLPGPNRPGTPRAKVRSATPDAFREEVSARAWANATAAMAPLLHPALRMKWLYNDLDVKFLGLNFAYTTVTSNLKTSVE